MGAGTIHRLFGLVAAGPIGNGVDESLILVGASACGDGKRLPMCLRPK